ncbi:MAG: hypothetical protein H0V53_08730 [Rubrobacter sp.]|nr:hypothetical protein [Rubrobacter sp.]
MTDLALLLLQAEIETTSTGVFRFFAGFVMILIVFSGALLFTYWISKDE